MGWVEANCTIVNLGLAQLNQWALDFEGNLERIADSIKRIKAAHGYYRVGPELEVCGYACDDHFFENDTTTHCWQSVAAIVDSDLTMNCLVDIGMPVIFGSRRYNCRVFILNREIILIRPKLYLANEASYREVRWFGAWQPEQALKSYVLPPTIQMLKGQKECPFGFAAIQCNDCVLASETCEELFVPRSPHLDLCLNGVDIFTNGSCSFFELNKVETRTNLILGPTQKMGGVYMYCNAVGNDGGLMFADGHSFVACNGQIVNVIDDVPLSDVNVIVTRVDLNDVRGFRSSKPNFNLQGGSAPPIAFVKADIWLSGPQAAASSSLLSPALTQTMGFQLPTKPQQIADCVSLWLFDFLRRSGAMGFFVPLSGGADSSSVVAMVRYMCDVVYRNLSRLARDGDKQNREWLETAMRNILKLDVSEALPAGPRDLCFQLLHTCYLSTHHSSSETREFAARVAKGVNSYHMEINVDDAVDAMVQGITHAFGIKPHFLHHRANPSSVSQDIALQNVQARIRMNYTYLLSSLLPTVRATDRFAPPTGELLHPPKSAGVPTSFASDTEDDADEADVPRRNPSPPFPVLAEDQRKRLGWIAVLGTGNADECIRGYFTKYDCSSADINPLGSLSKIAINQFLRWAARALDLPVLNEIRQAIPTAELRPRRRATTDLTSAPSPAPAAGPNAGPKARRGAGPHSGADVQPSQDVSLANDPMLQQDEEDMGISYVELHLLGDLRKTHRCGPVQMFKRLAFFYMQNKCKRMDVLLADLSDLQNAENVTAENYALTTFLHSPNLSIDYIAKLVKHFHVTFAKNRHKTLILTPSFHAEAYDPESDRFDWRPFLYPEFQVQFAQIDALAATLKFEEVRASSTEHLDEVTA